MTNLAAVTCGVWLILAGSSVAQIKVGVAGPLTGASRAYGAQIKNGVSQAIEDINAAGGIHNQKIIAIYGDDADDPVQGLVIANTLVREKVNYVIGHFSSAATLPASVIYEENGILNITPASTNTQITERGMWNIFRTCGRDDQQGELAGSYIVQHFNGKNIAIISDGTEFGSGLAKETKANINAHLMNEVLFDEIKVGQRDYADLIARLKDLNVDLVYVASELTEAALLLKQMRSEGLDAVMMGGDGLSAAEFAVIAGPAAEGTLMTFAPDPRDRPEARRCRGKIPRQEDRAGSVHAITATRRCKSSNRAVEMAESLDSRKVAAQITTGVKFKTVIGDLSYNKKGDITRYDYVMYQCVPDAGGRLVYQEIR